MSKTSNAVTIVACRPGMKDAASRTFPGMEIVVDDKLTKDYEFRERTMSLDELLEAEISKEEKQEADPKNAHTFVVPAYHNNQDVPDACWSIPYLVIRVERGPSSYDIIEVLKKTAPTLQGDFPDFEVNVSATMGALRAALKGAGFNVFSISEADGLTPLDS